MLATRFMSLPELMLTLVLQLDRLQTHLSFFVGWGSCAERQRRYIDLQPWRWNFENELAV